MYIAIMASIYAHVHTTAQLEHNSMSRTPPSTNKVFARPCNTLTSDHQTPLQIHRDLLHWDIPSSWRAQEGVSEISRPRAPASLYRLYTEAVGWPDIVTNENNIGTYTNLFVVLPTPL